MGLVSGYGHLDLDKETTEQRIVNYLKELAEILPDQHLGFVQASVGDALYIPP